MIELDDCGRELHCSYGSQTGYDTKVAMVIKAPRGIISLFNNQYTNQDTQCEGIKAFMEEHRND